MRISDWSSDVCSSDLGKRRLAHRVPKLALLAGLCLPAMAAAQDDAGSGGIQDIVVTAQKRAENVQDIPIAINALGGEALAERRIADPTDLVRQFPNLSFKQSSAVNAGISIRGVGTQNFHLTAQQAVGQYLDEVSLVTPFSSTFGLFDLERVEILRGPRSEEHTSELQSLMRSSYAVFCLKKKKKRT